MPARPRPASALLVVDPHEGRIALGRLEGHAAAPVSALHRDDGAAPVPCPKIGQPRLGDAPERTPAYADAALRAGLEALGLLYARPTPGGSTPPHLPGLWGRLAQHGLEPDRAALTYLGRAVSPASEAARWHVRVFAAPYAKVRNALGRSAQMERTTWLTPGEAETTLGDQAIQPFPALALKALGARPRPLLVTFRAGRRIVARL